MSNDEDDKATVVLDLNALKAELEANKNVEGHEDEIEFAVHVDKNNGLWLSHEFGISRVNISIPIFFASLAIAIMSAIFFSTSCGSCNMEFTYMDFDHILCSSRIDLSLITSSGLAKEGSYPLNPDCRKASREDSESFIHSSPSL